MSNDIEKKYLEIINNLDIGFFKGEFKGKLLMHNRTLNKILGIDPSKDLTGTSAIQFFYNPEDHEKYNEELMKNGHIRNLITKIKKINGDIIIVEINAHIVKNVDREQLTVEGTVIDRTEKYQIEQKLKDFEVKFKLILDNSTDLIAFLNKKFVHEFINENAYLKVLGYSREDIIGKRATDFIHPEDMIRISKTLKKGFLKGKFSDEHRVKHKNGHYIWVETKGNFIKDNGQIKGLIYISRVINKRKEAEEELKKFKSILDNANYGVGIINRGGNFAYLNDYFAEIHGYKTNELIGKNLTIFHNDAQLERVMDLKKKLEEEGSYNAEEVWHKHKDGSVFPMLMNGITINDDKGNPLFMASTTIDITELKKAEQKLKEFERIKIPYFEAIESLGEVKKYIEKVLRDGAYLFETKHQTKDGKIKDILVNGQAISIHGKKYIQSIFRDITDIKKTERQSKESKEKFSYRHNISIILGLVFPAIYLIIEGLIDNFIFRNTEFLFQDIFTTDPHEILMHLIPISLILFSGIFSQYLINAQRKAEDKLKEAKRDLMKKVKEVTCLYELSKLIETLDISLEDLILGTLNIIPPAYQFPDITTARIIYKDRVYSLENFTETKWKMSIKMMIMKFPILIEVCYLENKSFISEEYDLLIEIGTQLKRILDGREIQRKLKESEETYRLLFESSTDGIASADMEGNFIEINKVFLDLLGYSREELLKLNFRDITPQKWHEMEDNLLIKQLSEEKDSGIYEKEYIQKDGTIIPIDIRSWIVKDNQGDPIRMWFIVRDITDRKIVEKEISDLAKFPSENPNPVLRATQNRILYANKSGIELLKVDIEGNIPEFLHEIIQESLSKNIKQELDIELANQIYSFTISPIKAMGYVNIYGINITDRIKAEEEIASLAKFPSEDPYPVLRVNLNNVLYINNAGQKLLKIDDNDEIPEIFRVKIDEAFINNAITEVEAILNSRIYSFNIIPIRGSNYVNIYGMDITERKQVEQKLKEVNKLKSEFLRRASHELKTPLISIKGFSDLILSLYSDQLDIPIISKLKEINNGCERLQNIINNLLKSSRLESPNIRPKIQKEDLSFLIKFCLHELQSLAERRKQSINLDIHSELHANIEKEEIHDVISNLVTNAIKYTPPRGKIDIKTELKEDFVVVSVKDNGIGFTEDQKKKIFQQFGKIERYGQGLDLGIDGTGLGLYISKRIVESHGGKIWMESEGRNKGSTFYFTIPTVK